MDSIVLSLGHNSSAIAIRDGHILGGYETERFTGKKADSAYPKQAIEKLIADHAIDTNATVFTGHWFLDGRMPAQSNKYIDYDHLHSVLPGHGIESLHAEFSHHDSHIESAMVFAGDDFAPTYHAFVMDGFGSFGECFSVYQVTGASYKLLNRWFGYEKSLGMLYQYATAYMGMKQHNHEYKILAYEVHAGEYSDVDAIKGYADQQAADHVRDMIVGQMDSTYDPMISLEALPRIQLAISDRLDRFCVEFNIDKGDEREFRSCVSHFVQRFVESVAMTIIRMYSPKDALLVGGLFYNVKLNSLISKQVTGRTCIMPLAGDQGAGLGVYQHHVGDLVWPGHLNWGHRDLNFKSKHAGLVVVPTMDDAKQLIELELSRIGFVNLVRGAMEFGPRALCNTSTIALPNLHVCGEINEANGRTTEMPMAPFMARSTAQRIFADCDKIHKSLEYMIVTRDYQEGMGDMFDGAAHYYPDQGVYTGRPQVTDDPDLLDILGTLHDEDVLVNTSFNYHGQPIVMGQESIENAHAMQCKNKTHLNIKTIVVAGE